MTRGSDWWARQVVAMPEFGTARMAGSVSAVLFTLCGLLVADFGFLIPDGHGVHHRLVLAIGLLAVASGGVIALLPWQRWRRSSTLWLVPLAFGLIAAHNYATGADGFRYGAFFFVVFVWIGLMHPNGTALVFTPLLALAYLAPGLWLHDLGTLAAALTYSVPVCLLVGECTSLVAARLHHSEETVRANEERFRALVHNAMDVITVIDADGLIRWESPSITGVLGYTGEERLGTNAFLAVHPDDIGLVESAMAGLLTAPDRAQAVEVRARHKDGSWRWCEARATNLLDDPAVAGIVVNFADVTERHRGEDIRRQLAAIVESSNDAISGHALDGTVLSWNSAAERMFHWSADEIVGANMRALVPDDRVDELAAMLARVAAGDALATVETQRRRKDGVVLDVALSLSPVRDGAGQVVAISAITHDITDRLRARRELADREASFRLLFAANPQPMWVYDAATTKFLEVNDAAVRHYGHSREVFLGMHVGNLGPVAEGPTRHVLADGRVIDVELTSHRLVFAGRDAVLVAVQDVTERNALDAQLRHQAFHDSLTGLSNRALFADRLEHAFGRRTADEPILLLLDLDRLKAVNDSLGHAAGDEMLVEVARRLESSVRLGDTVARLGGDEFAILLEECPASAAQWQATRVLEALEQPMYIGGRRVVATASIGIAIADPATTAGALMRNADIAMYRAKAAGGARFELFDAATTPSVPAVPAQRQPSVDAV